jgi:uncharacterized surface protein with fasciclin (FAS1) repeats
MKNRYANSLVAAALTVTFATLAMAPVAHAGAKEGKQPIFAIAQSAGFNTLAKAVKEAGLQQTLTTGGPFTVFAPTDEAFAALPAGVLESLLADKDALKNVLLYHVVAGEVTAAQVVSLTSATMANGDAVTIDARSGVKVNQANVVKTDIMAKNGVIHVIDAVLIPPAK